MPKVLIVDDEIDNCRMLALGLQMFGFQSEIAVSGAQALAKTQASLPDAIVLDLMMPDTDGFEVTRYLRANPDTAKVPIFIVSATADTNAEEYCLQVGATAFMRKPVSVRELANVIKKSLTDQGIS